MPNSGDLRIARSDGIARVTFSHPKANSLPLSLLESIAKAITECGEDKSIDTIILQSAGDKTFCAGASFDELKALDSQEAGKAFFMGFAKVILSMIRCPKIVICRVQGKAVGGGVGMLSAADYVLAHDSAAIRLSEFELGLGPFVVGPAVEYKLGHSAYRALALDCEWRSASWALEKGLFDKLYTTHEELDEAVSKMAQFVSSKGVEAGWKLKQTFWSETGDWEALLPARAEISGALALGKKFG